MPAPPEREDLSLEQVAHAERVAHLDLGAASRQRVLRRLNELRRSFLSIRNVPLPNHVAPAVRFRALLPGAPRPADTAPAGLPPGAAQARSGERPGPFADVPALAAALRQGRVRARELAERSLERLERFDPQLRCVVTLLPELALAQADRADRELAEGIDRGPLHGIPYGAKDLLAHPASVTTWGAGPYRGQRLAEPATVLTRLEQAGAVLVAKVSLGELAMDDVWFGGQTRNPWNPEEGSSGSSSGSAAAVAAGLVPFALGSETMGSILSPAERCGVVGLRPTFGRVSRHGAMALAWSFDKLGVLARTPQDAALVLAAMQGADGEDGDAVDVGFPWNPDGSLSGLRVGVPEDELRERPPAVARALQHLAELDLDPRPITLPELPGEPMMTLVITEAAAAFDALVRDGGIDRLVRHDDDAWSTHLRAARLVPAVEHLQAQRLRTLVQHEMARLFEAVDVYLCTNGHELSMLHGNGAGLPAVSLPLGAGEGGRPTGNVSIVARPFFDHQALRLAHALASCEGPLPGPAPFA